MIFRRVNISVQSQFLFPTQHSWLVILLRLVRDFILPLSSCPGEFGSRDVIFFSFLFDFFYSKWMRDQCSRGIRSLNVSEKEEQNYFSPPVKMSHYNSDWETVGAAASSSVPKLLNIQSRKDDLTNHLCHPFIFTYHLLLCAVFYLPVPGSWPLSTAHLLVLGQAGALKATVTQEENILLS